MRDAPHVSPLRSPWHGMAWCRGTDRFPVCILLLSIPTPDGRSAFLTACLLIRYFVSTVCMYVCIPCGVGESFAKARRFSLAGDITFDYSNVQKKKRGQTLSMRRTTSGRGWWTLQTTVVPTEATWDSSCITRRAVDESGRCTPFACLC